MKRIMQIITAAVLSVGFIGSVASAASCSDVIIVNSGDNNHTEVSCENVNTITLSCVDNKWVANVNYQQGTSGDAESVNGTATSGSVTNDNETTTQLGSSCGATTTPTSPTPTPSVTPSPSTTPAAVKQAKLPYTAGTSAESVIVISLAAAASIVIASRLVVAAYRRSSIK